MLGIKRQPATRSVIGAGMRVQGPCTFSDGLQIDGEVLGDVTAEGGQPSVLVIGEGGSVQGAISADQARSHPHRNVVTQALGVTDPDALNVETLSGELVPGTQLLLCSDGLTEEVDDAVIARVLAHTECSAQECVDGLVAAALDGGGSDNVTVILIRRQ